MTDEVSLFQDTKRVLKEGVEKIEKSAFFAECSSLRHFAVPEFVRHITSGVFENCTQIAEIRIPEYIKFISGEAFFRVEKQSENLFQLQQQFCS